jgi:phage terminase large subunit
MINLNISSKVFNPTYYPYLNDDTYCQIFFGGSSSGKSYFLAQRCVLDMIKGGHNYLIVRNVQNTVKKSVFNEITKAISFFKLAKYFSINKTDFIITCHNGYQIMFAGLDDSEKIKSVTPSKGVITDIWVEEATECEYNAIKQLRKRLRGISKVKKRIILSFNPILKTHWIYTEYFGNWDESKQAYREDRFLVLKTTYKDNKFLTEDDIYELENEPDKYWRDVYTYGNWGVLGHVIFTNYVFRDLTEERKRFDNLRCGLDFGYTDPTGIVKLHLDMARKKLYILEESYETNLTNDLLAVEIKRVCGDELVTCDSEDPKSIQELRNLGISATGAIKGKGSVNFGIQWLQQFQIIIDIKCQNYKNEIQQYRWQEDKDGNVLPIPVDKANHLIDPTRYACERDMGQLPQRGNNVKIPRMGAM